MKIFKDTKFTDSLRRRMRDAVKQKRGRVNQTLGRRGEEWKERLKDQPHNGYFRSP